MILAWRWIAHYGKLSSASHKKSVAAYGLERPARPVTGVVSRNLWFRGSGDVSSVADNLRHYACR